VKIYEEHNEIRARAAGLHAEDTIEAQEVATLEVKIPGMAPGALRSMRERSLVRKRQRRAGIAKQLDEMETRYGELVRQAPELAAVASERGRVLAGKLVAARMALARVEKAITGGLGDDVRRLRAAELRDECAHLDRLLREETAAEDDDR
jgi:hypothetical protein